MNIIRNLYKRPVVVEKETINAGIWKEVDTDTVAPCDGIYVFYCKGDNHMMLEVYSMFEGQRLWEFFEGEYEHVDGWCVVKPEMYYFVPAPYTQTINNKSCGY